MYRTYSNGILLNVVICVAMTSLVTGMMLTSRAKKDTSSVQTNHEIEPWRPYYISHSCEWTLLSLDCPMGRVINIVRATYGRQNLDYCPHLRAKSVLDWDTPCVGSISKSRRIVSGMCNGKHRCEVPVFNGLFGDPCPSTYKYLEVYYACVDSNPRLTRK